MGTEQIQGRTFTWENNLGPGMGIVTCRTSASKGVSSLRLMIDKEHQ